MKRLRNYFKTVTSGLRADGTIGGTRFLKGNKPTEDVFKDLRESHPMFLESNDRAKVSTGGSLGEEVGLVTLATNVQVKANAIQLTDRSLVVQPHQLPTVESATNDFTVATVSTDGVNSVTQDPFDIVVDTLTTTRNKFTVKFKLAFVKWLLRRVVPAGGTIGQALIKGSATDYDFSWGAGTGGGGGGSSIIDITYANLVIAITGSTLAKGSYYRITDYATVHNILTSSPNVVNTGTTEPLVVLATDVNKITEQAYSTLYPQDIIKYTVDNTFIAGATKGCILFRHDIEKNISCYYDWRNVKFRDYGALWQSTNLTIGSGAGASTITAVAGVDVYTFAESQNPTNCFNIHIGLLSTNSRLNNIIFAQNSVFYSTLSYKNINIAEGCSEIRIGNRTYPHSYNDVNGLNIGGNNSKIIIDATDLRCNGTIGTSNLLMRISPENTIHIGNKNNNIYIARSINTLNIGNLNSNISVKFTNSKLSIQNSCVDIYVVDNSFNYLDNVRFCDNVLAITINNISGGGFSNVVFGHNFRSKIFNTDTINNTQFLISNTTTKTYTTAKSNVIFNMLDSAGDIWANEITISGVVTTYKQV